MPAPSLPNLSLFGYFLGDALAISVVSLVITISMGKLFAKKHKYEIDVRQVWCTNMLRQRVMQPLSKGVLIG